MCLMDLARRCVQLAHTLWKLLDLQSSPQKISQRPVFTEEHINIFWCIFILEVSIPMSASKRIASSAVNEMSMPVEQPGSRGRNHFLAAIHVARLRHNVLITGAASPPVHTAQDLAIRHLEELQKIQSALDIDVEVPFASCSMSNEFQLWTTLSCLTTRLIINETFPESQYHDLVHSTAQNAIFIITSMGMDTGEKPEDQPLLPLYLYAYTFVLFCD